MTDKHTETRQPDTDGRVREMGRLSVTGPDHIGRVTVVSHAKGAVFEMVRHGGLVTTTQAAEDARQIAREHNAYGAMLEALR